MPRQLKQCPLEFACVCPGTQVAIYLYNVCLQPVRAESTGLWLWKVAWLPVCKLINNGYCQGNVWATCYNEHSETYQHTPPGSPVFPAQITVSPWDSPFPPVSGLLLSVPSLHWFCFLLPVHILLTGFLLISNTIFISVRGDFWEFLDRKRGEGVTGL